jgi:hypothetical protein
MIWGKGGDEAGSYLPVFRRHAGAELLPDELVTGLTKVPAVCFVHKDMGAIRKKPTDELGLVFDHVPVSLLALPERVLSLFLLGDVG